MEMLMEYMAKGFVAMLSISMPCVLVAAGIGLVVGILQAVTQVQEQTIAAAPKILAVFLVIVIGGVGFVRILTNLFTDGMALAFNVVPRSDNYVLSSNYYKYTKPPFMDEFNASEPDKLNGNFSKDSTAPTGLGSKLKNQEIYIQQRDSADPKPDFLEDLTIKFRRGR